MFDVHRVKHGHNYTPICILFHNYTPFAYAYV